MLREDWRYFVINVRIGLDDERILKVFCLVCDRVLEEGSRAFKILTATTCIHYLFSQTEFFTHPMLREISSFH